MAEQQEEIHRLQQSLQEGLYAQLEGQNLLVAYLRQLIDLALNQEIAAKTIMQQQLFQMVANQTALEQRVQELMHDNILARVDAQRRSHLAATSMAAIQRIITAFLNNF